MKKFKQELTNLVFEYVQDVDLHNARSKDVFEDKVEYSFENFIKWLDFNQD